MFLRECAHSVPDGNERCGVRFDGSFRFTSRQDVQCRIVRVVICSIQGLAPSQMIALPTCPWNRTPRSAAAHKVMLRGSMSNRSLQNIESPTDAVFRLRKRASFTVGSSRSSPDPCGNILCAKQICAAISLETLGNNLTADNAQFQYRSRATAHTLSIASQELSIPTS